MENSPGSSARSLLDAQIAVMRTELHLSMRLCVVAFFALPLVAGAQRLSDPGVEWPTDTGFIQPVNWYMSEGLQARSSTENPAEGGRSLHLKGRFTPDVPGHLVQWDTSRYTSLQKLHVSVKVKIRTAASGVELIAYSTAADGGTLNYQAVKALGDEASDQWQELSLSLWVNETVRILRVGLQFKDTVDLLVDDLKVDTAALGDAPVAPELLRYADEMLDLITEHSLHRSTLDSASLRRDLHRLLSGGRSLTDFHAVANFFLKSVDKHSFYWSKAEVDAWSGDDNTEEEQEEGTPLFDFPITTGHLIGKDVAYLSMPQFHSGNEAWNTYFADTLQGLIRALDRPGLKGWVLDLRQNHGGNCWPMLAGIGPVLGNGVCGYFGLDDDRFYWSYMDGSSLTDDTVQCSVSRSPYVLLATDPRVAVITGPGTASSGEVVTVAFRGRPGARSFGTPTAGYSTTNTNFDLSDGAMLFLATSVYVDRAKNPYGDAIPPDELIPTGAEGDAPLERAVQWLRSQ
jgi:carboxyl-terminal processing protease